MCVCVCVCVCVPDVTDKLSSKLRQNKNNTNSSLYQIYLPKLHGNFLKYYRLDLFKEITIDFNHGFQTTLQSPASLSDGLLG